ncbi:hypothetical protein COY28_01815 [Candidatus Woesearchaeota archaeon CG_4_10_14_0_2_um_filter_57_5]|nr:MAG: hypothetical protein AUJ68_05100 [Candidatus Woesearchaeota archaeon CG1_02_57_44]PIN69400.1 MAG: hypothetical protein COV94_02905 [Candidatus Woesearchaeota archaeon CG11_big_fil_rev_8_21_14_0_20_57_5]PIZ55568.1 MAG: hypothetical protein COY28_01815 [Candidatus Woesearchaeota archaeon CG_4_10_14_0_2_um_filter_57_5]
MRFSQLASCFLALEATSKRLEKTSRVSALIRQCDLDLLEPLLLLLQGRIYRLIDPREPGVSDRTMIKALQTAYGISPAAIETRWRKHGDLGLVAEELAKAQAQVRLVAETLDLQRVHTTLTKLAVHEGAGAIDHKVRLITELLSHADPAEARYIVRLVLGQLRMGVGEGIIRDAICWAFLPMPKGLFDSNEHCDDAKDNSSGNKTPTSGNRTVFTCDTADDALIIARDNPQALLILPDESAARQAYNLIISTVQHALDVSNDFAAVALVARTRGIGGLQAMDITPGKPLKVMLAQKAESMEKGLASVGLPCQAEYKYDGFRVQIHIDPHQEVSIFTRRLENVTRQFPDIVSMVKDLPGPLILDAEAVGIDQDGSFLPFQSISQRIRRKHRIADSVRRLRVQVHVFDVLYRQGSMLSRPFQERRKAVQELVPINGPLQAATATTIAEEKDAVAFYEKALAAHNEGIMLKAFDAPYRPGSRVGSMVKVKPVMDGLDLVIVEAEWGEGKRATWLTSFTLACQHQGTCLAIGKVGTGLKEKLDDSDEETLTFAAITEALRPLIERQEGRAVWLRPELVVEVAFEEIQKSPSYASGYALRFPRMIRLREDRAADDAASLDEVRIAYEQQYRRGLT